jgi:CBS domain-containing protein
MTRDVEVVHPNDSLQAAARKMQSRDVGFLPVCEGDRITGVVSDRDITLRGTAKGLDPATARVSDVLTPTVIYCFEDQDVDEAAQVLQDKQIRRLVILSREGKRLAGIVSLGDLATRTDRELSGQVLRRVSEPLGAA